MRARTILVLVTAAAAAACSGDGGGSGASPATTTSVPPSSVALAEPKLPAIQPVAKAGGATIKASREADWVVVAYGRAWISGLGKGIGVYDARTGRPLGSVAVPEVPCAAPDAGFGAVWTATCEPSGVSRIDPATARITGHAGLSATPEGESSIGVGEGAVWALIDGSDCRRCAVARIDPKTLKVTGRYPVPPGPPRSGPALAASGSPTTGPTRWCAWILRPARSLPPSRWPQVRGSSTSARVRSG